MTCSLYRQFSPHSHSGGEKSFDISTEIEEIIGNIKKLNRLLLRCLYFFPYQNLKKNQWGKQYCGKDGNCK